MSGTNGTGKMGEEEKQFELAKIRNQLNNAIANIHTLERKLEKLEFQNTILVEEKKQWVASKEKQDSLVYETITNSNSKNNEYLEIIQDLQNKRFEQDKIITELRKEIINLRSLIKSE